MRKHLPLIIFFFLIAFNPSNVFGQEKPAHKLFLRSGTITPPENIATGSTNLRKSTDQGKTFVIIQFYDIPTQSQRDLLKNAGIELLEYIPDYAYTATVAGAADENVLKQANARSVVELAPEQKIEKSLLNSDVSGTTDTIQVRLSYPAGFTFEEVENGLKDNKIPIVSEAFKSYQILEVEVAANRLTELAGLPFVQYLGPLPGKPVPLNDRSVANTKASVLSSPEFGFNLTGKGVVVGIGDNTIPSWHLDLSGRSIFIDARGGGSDHGLHVTGTVAGAGLINEKYRGYAPKASIINARYEDIWKNAERYVSMFGMVISNHSYGTSEGCPTYGSYASDTYVLDRQAFLFPSLIQVFAAGNSGLVNCPGYPNGFGNIASDYASAKNVISVGQSQVNGIISTQSSKGPVKDGRIKPDLIAPGTSIYSTTPFNKYLPGTGTSMSAPAVAGGLALLYERYRQLNGQQNPKNALMKALVCNGSFDYGLAGPDYSYGFGGMDLFRSLKMLNAAHYFEGQIGHQGKNQHKITIPANTAQLKVMLYWNDPAQSLLGDGKTLVNNLDIKILTPTQTTLLPQFPNASNATAAALPGTDNVNNAEQITIINPAVGEYTVEVQGTFVTSGNQEYFLVYDPIETSTVLTYPAGKEKLIPGENVSINWESNGNSASKFSLQYSLNNGTTWIAIDNNVASTLRHIAWRVPSASTHTAKVRVIQNDTGVTHESGSFTILDAPIVSLSSIQCQGYFALQWTAVTGATSYEVMQFKGEDMVPVASLNGLNYTFSGLSKDSTYYVTVRAIKDGLPGRRGVAVIRKPEDGSCAGSISDNDMLLDAIVSPAGSGRLYTQSELKSDHEIKIRLKNLDDQESGPVEVGFALGDESAPIHWETIGQSILGGWYEDYTFAKKVDLHELRSYHLRVYVKKSGDMVGKNNFLEMEFKQVDNLPITLPYLERFEIMPDQEITGKAFAMNGAERYDFLSSQAGGRLRTAPFPGSTYSGNKAITLDVKTGTYENNTNYVNGTFNLGNYHIETDEILMTFAVRRHGDSGYNNINDFGTSVSASDVNDGIRIFGNDRPPVTTSSGYQTFQINLSEALKSRGLDFTKSVQLRWEQFGNQPALNAAGVSGYSFDDVRIYKTTSDIELVEILPPPVKYCWWDAYPLISIRVKNNGSDDCYGIPVKAELGEGSFGEGRIAFLRAHSDTIVEVSNLTYLAPDNSEQKLKIWVRKPYDSNPENDFAEIMLKNPPQVSSFPYLENFETGNGNWFTRGDNSSWEYGMPNSGNLKKAASGRNIWKTNLKGVYNNNELSYLYSPCFYLGSMQQPTLSFSASTDLEKCPDGVCDEVYLEYLNNSGEWVRLGSKGSGVNWYDTDNKGLGSWTSKGYSRWHVCTIALPNDFPYPSIRFRFVLKSNGSIAREGLAIDDIHIYDLINEIDESINPLVIEKSPINDPYHMDFINGDNQITVALQSESQIPGNVLVTSFLNTQPVRISNNKYYLDRNFKITKTSGNLLTPVTVRLYITDTEIERLISAPDKTGVQKPQSAYDLAITQYSGTNEDGNLLNNAANTWTFIPAAQVTKVPYGKGYYFEFKAKNFSEFWFANDYIGQGSSLPVELISFSAKKAGNENSNDVLLKWATASEKDFSHFEIEVAEDEQQVRKQLFSKIGEVKGFGLSVAQQIYTWTDRVTNPAGTRYYRLKMVDTDQTFSYSAIRSVSFDQNIAWKLYPNPSRDFFEVEFQAEKAQQVDIHLYEIGGRLIKNETLSATGSVQVKNIDLSKENLPSGIYMLEVVAGEQKQTFKILKE